MSIQIEDTVNATEMESQVSPSGNENRPSTPTPQRRGASEIDALLWRLRARTEFSGKLGQVFGFTSFCRKSGVSTIVANLAIRASEHHMGPVLLIDANVLAPRQHRNFRVRPQIGLVDVLVGSTPPPEAIYPTKVMQLDLMAFGASNALAKARIMSDNYHELINWARSRYSMIFIDLPQINEMRHALMLARLADSTLIAIRSEAVRRQDAVLAIERAKDDGVKIGGTLLTRKRIYTPSYLRG